MYSPLRARLGPKPSTSAPRSPSRSPQVIESSSPSSSYSPSTAYVSPYRAPPQPSPGKASSPLSKVFSNGKAPAIRFGVSPLNASALGASGDEGLEQQLSSTGTPLRGNIAAASPPASPFSSPPHSTTTGHQGRIGTVPQGGAVGLWRVARDGHSPIASGHEEPNSPGAFAQRPSTQGANDRASGAGRIGGTNSALTSISNVTSAPMLNMSLDEALMGGLLGEAKQNIVQPSPTRSTLFARTSTLPGSNKRPSLPTTHTKTPGSGFFRSASATTSLASHSVAKPSYLIPPLQLPTYKRPVSIPEQADSATVTDAQSPTVSEAIPGWITVVFDLDETLCNNRLPGKACLRPGCIELLNALAAIRDDFANSHCFIEIILWTASMECVARPVVERMDPQGTIFNHLIYRDRRWYKDTGYTKDLRLLGRDLSHVVIIENSPMSVVLNRNHAILVKDFVGGGTYNHYYGGGALNTRTSTGSLSDPTLFIVNKVLCEWARAVGQYACEGTSSNVAPNPNPNPMALGGKAHNPAFVSLPGPIGIVEFLRESPDISHNNEVILNGANAPRTGGAVSGAACGSPARAIPRATIGAKTSWGTVGTPIRSLTASPGRVTRYR